MSLPERFASSVATVALALAAGATAQDAQASGVDAPPPDLAAWPCKFCTFETGSEGWLEPRIGFVSDPSFRFGDYTGLEDRGAVVDLSGAWRYRDEATAQAWDARAERLGLDSRAIGLWGGRQGLYGIRLGYEGLPHLTARDSRTPFFGASQLGLPAGWSSGGSTREMAALDTSLHGVWLRQERERALVGLTFTPHRAADLRFDYRRDEIRGTGAVGGSFMTLASQLPRPIDQTLDRADVSAGFRHALGHAQLALASSFFANGVDSLAWQNPYNPPSPGATQGQMAVAPDNEAHRLSLTLGTAPALPVQVSAQLASGRMTQDERFLPATVNPDEAVALPRTSLDGRVETTLASVRAGVSLPLSLRATADVLHDERDNRTPVASWTQVVMDTFTGGVRANTPYGFTRDRVRLGLERRGAVRVGVGAENDRRERRLYGTRETEEQKVWARLGLRSLRGDDFRLRVTHAERDGAELVTAPDAPPQNPLLRAFNTADRRRDEVRADVSSAIAVVTGALHLTWARDEYPASPIGRRSRSELGYGADVLLEPVAGFSASLFASREEQEMEQAGSQSFASPDWLARQDDASSTFGTRLHWQAPRGFTLGADYVWTAAEGVVVLASGAGADGFPRLVTRWQDARLYGSYALRPDLSLRLDMIHERYEAQDWALDSIAPDTIPNLLALGQGTQSAAVNAVLLSARYRF